MSFERKRRISIGLTSAYFLTTAVLTGFVVMVHASISCCGVALLLLTAPFLLYSALAHHGMEDFKRPPAYIDPADFGMSIGTANFIRTLGLLLPVPLLAYSLFFMSGLTYFALDGSPESVARTYAVINFDHKIFGHRMAQREYRRAARIYGWKHNYKLAQMFIRGGIACAEEHTADKPSRSRDLHIEAGKFAYRSGNWDLADKEFSLALQISKDKCGCDENSRVVKMLEKKLHFVRNENTVLPYDDNCAFTYAIDPQTVNGLQLRRIHRYYP